ncbi:MAG: ATP-dependent DNA helicase RecG, partial [Rhodocyclaceae bacterium]|nr:ATP-dependent DNA helicase RecG [Rhodocyclaceae bacterium]
MAKASIPGATPLVAEKLAALGLKSQADLVLHLPLRFEDETRLTAIADAVPGATAQFEATVVSSEIVSRPRRQLVCRVADGTGVLVLRFLHFYPSQQKALQPGARLRLFGEVRGGFWGSEIIHPRFRPLQDADAAPLPTALTPVYPTTAGLGQGTLRKLISRALAEADLSETLPAPLLARWQLEAFATSVQALHAPPPGLDAAALAAWQRPYWRRIAFDELLAQQISLRQAYAARRARGAPPLIGDNRLVGALIDSLPFPLTAAQRRVWREIEADLACPHPMQRLLQGDVGSGKTVIGLLVARVLQVRHGIQIGWVAMRRHLLAQA